MERLDRTMLRHKLISHALNVRKDDDSLVLLNGKTAYAQDEAWVAQLLEIAQALAESEKSLWQNFAMGMKDADENVIF